MLEVVKVNMFADAASFYFLSFEMVKLVWVTLFFFLSPCAPVTSPSCYQFLFLDVWTVLDVWTLGLDCSGWRQTAFSDGHQYWPVPPALSPDTQFESLPKLLQPASLMYSSPAARRAVFTSVWCWNCRVQFQVFSSLVISSTP